MPNQARQFNGKSVITVIHDPVLGELQIVATEPRPARPRYTAGAPANAPASRVAPAAHRPTGPPVASRLHASGKGGRHG